MTINLSAPRLGAIAIGHEFPDSLENVAMDRIGAKASNYIGEQLQVGTSSRSRLLLHPEIPMAKNALLGQLLSVRKIETGQEREG